MGWLRQLKESYWQPNQIAEIDGKLEPLRTGDTSAAQLSPIERFVEVERDLGRLTLLNQALVEICVRKGLLSHEEIAALVRDVDLTQSADTRWGAAATERPSLPLALATNGHAAANVASTVAMIDDFENADAWGGDEPSEGAAGTALATGEDHFDFGGGAIDSSGAIDVAGEEGKEGVATIPRTAPFPKPKKKVAKSSPLRQIVGMAVSGVIGLGMGYFILLWFAGQDIINAAHMLPQWMVPQQFRAAQPSQSAPAKNPGDLAAFPAPTGEFPETKNWGPIDGAGQNGGRQGTPSTTPRTKPKDELTLLDEPGASGNADLGNADPTSFEPPLSDDPLAPNISIAPPIVAPQPKPTPPAASSLDDEESTSTAPTPTSDPESDPLAATEPAPTGKPLTTEKPPASDKPATEFAARSFVVQGAVAVDGPTLGEAVRAANLATLDLTSGELTDEATKKAKVTAYQKFCDLAKALTFVDGEPVENELETRRLAAQRVATLAVEEEAAFKDVAVIATQWIGLPADRRSTSGVFLTGTVKDVQPAGELKVALIELGSDRLVSVVTPFDADVVETDRVAVLGVVVEDPTAELTGYEGAAGKAVWSEHVLKVESPNTFE